MTFHNAFAKNLKGNLQTSTIKFLKQHLTSPILNPINANEAWSKETLRDKLTYDQYFEVSDEVDFKSWPEAIQSCWEKDLAALSLGLAILYLQEVFRWLW